MDIEKIYDSFVENSVRLSKSKDLLQMVATEYVFKEMPPNVIITLLKSHPELPLPFFNKDVLNNEEILIQTIKIISLMEASNTWDDFKKLHRKRKRNANPKEEINPQGFDKILKGIMQVPKPKENKKEQ
jgi:hypothetical protein